MNVWTCAGTIAAALAIAATPSLSKPNSEQLAALAKLFPDAGKAGIPGCTMDVRKDGKAIFGLTYGMANLELPAAIKADTVFEAGSVSKQFVGAAIAQLSAGGKLALDDDVRKYIPAMPDYGTMITIRNLLNHTSGIRDWHDLTEIQGWGEGLSAYTQDFAVDLIAHQRGVNFRPGSEYSYSNSNFILAAAIVARVSGKSLDAFSQEAFFRPLGMTKTSWRKDFRDVVPGRAQGYGQDDSGAWKLDMPFESTMGGGGLLTTVSDMQTWNKFLSTPPAKDASWVASMTLAGKLTNGRTVPYGLGIELQTIKGSEAFSHAGWTAGYKAYLGRVPSQDISAAILCNTSAINTEEVGPQVLGMFAADVSAPPPVAVRLQNPDAALTAKVPGKYRVVATGAVVEITLKDGGLSFNGGPVIQGGAGGRYFNAEGTREATVTLSPTGDVTAILLMRTNNADLQLVPIAPWTPDAAALQAFAGAYASSDTQARLAVRTAGDALIVTGANALWWSVKPIYQDTFEGEDYSSWRIAFLRTAKGDIEAMTLTRSRTRALGFERLR